MKTRTTRKAVKERFDTIIEVGYCDIQALLRAAHAEPFGYTCGVYGWNADIYNISYNNDSVAIVTGYQPFGNYKASYDTCKKYEDIARAALDAKTFKDINAPEFIAEMQALLNDFIVKVIDNA